MPPSPISNAADTAPTAGARPVVLVTGAAKRLGREIALGLAASGWSVAIHYRGAEAEALATVADCVSGGAAHRAAAAAFPADLGNEAEARALVPQVVARLGRLDAIVNSASRFEQDSPADFGFAALDAHLHVNTGAAIVLAQALHAELERRGTQGAVVNLLDQKLHNLNPDFFSYTLSKAALEAGGTMLAQAFAPRLRVVGVAPGLTLGNPLLDAARFERLHRMAPLGRSSTPADIVHAVRFALDNVALTGTTLVVDGGQHLVRQPRDFALMHATDVPEGSAEPAPLAVGARPTTGSAPDGNQVLALSGFRFDANLGLLAHEREAAQPIEVTAQLNMGSQPLRPAHDQLDAVLDYRAVRQMIIDECTAVHVNLLESLTGKLCQRLLALPGVVGVRVRIVKLEIFPDCTVSIEKQAGSWN